MQEQTVLQKQANRIQEHTDCFTGTAYRTDCSTRTGKEDAGTDWNQQTYRNRYLKDTTQSSEALKSKFIADLMARFNHYTKAQILPVKIWYVHSDISENLTKQPCCYFSSKDNETK
ncbi:hypothetical protein CDAR_599641 [Caerostris darwini]|uniref:Uncharacterized protein n=1 Tax=Caerostris darwini TaxID=1538125 RepID=A0AAV4NXM0_9ARAC|nr:hypothetical protein CDAR_599641 [Caerostris darwini]